MQMYNKHVTVYVFLERLMIDFVFGGGEQSQITSYNDLIGLDN